MTDSTNNGNEANIVKEQPKIKRDFYQTDAEIVINFLIKNLKKEQVQVDINEDNIHVRWKLPDDSSANFNEEISLAHPVVPSLSSYKILSTKIEIKLKKRDGGSWSTLEKASKPKVLSETPSYPSSSKNKKDWGRLEKDIDKEIPDDEDVNALFAKIFAQGDDNTKKAMLKSMQESGGTVLSTNWDEVGRKKVEISPPDGMEWKKWDDSDSTDHSKN